MWSLLFRFVWARRWRAEGCSWSAVPRVFALSSILAEIRAAWPCKHPGRMVGTDPRGRGVLEAASVIRGACQSELPRAVAAILHLSGARASAVRSSYTSDTFSIHRCSLYASGELVLLFKFVRLDIGRGRALKLRDCARFAVSA